MDIQDTPGIRRRMRASDLGSGSSASGAVFDRNAALKEAVTLGVCLEDRAQLEALARFAFASPGFRAQTTVRVGDDRSEQVRFEVVHTDQGPKVRVAPDDAAPTSDVATDAPPGKPSTADLARLAELADLGRIVESPRGPGLESLPALLAEAAEHSPDSVALFTSTGWAMRWANNALRDRLQLPVWVEPTLVELLDDASQGRFVVRVIPALLSTGAWRGPLTLVGPDAAPHSVSATLVAHRNLAGEIVSVVLGAQPTPEPTRARPAVGDAPFAALVEHVSDLVAVMDPAGMIRFTSSATSVLLGLEPQELAGMRLAELIHPDDEITDIAELVRLDADGAGAPSRLRLRGADDSWCTIEAVVTDLTANPAIGGFVLNGRDISERMRAHDLLSHLAYTDADTGLPNRLRLLDRVTNLLEDPAGPGLVTVLLVDLDRFRAVNDACGPVTGDAVLAEMGRRLVEAAGSGALVARLRSDEFAVALSDVGDATVGERAAEALRVRLSRPFEHGGHTVRITASIGIALGAAGEQADEILRRADQASSAAKRDGGNRIVLWGDDAARHESRRRAVEGRLRRALDDGGVRVHFQPIVSVATGSTVGAEALMRVSDDEGALLNPAEFVEAAESSGLISQLGSQMLEATCEQLSRWGAQLRDRSPEHVSVNISPRQLIDPGLAPHVMAALEANAIEPNRLWLEVTESTLIGQHQLIGQRIAFLRDLGVRVGLDEFGAGYSTLNYLRRFPIDFVKIDRSLIAGLGVDDRDTAIVRATIELAHTLKLTVVAVGVENQGQLDHLTGLGCDQAQGFLFSLPVDPEQLRADLEAGPGDT